MLERVSEIPPFDAAANEARRMAAARRLIGDDVMRGLAVVRELSKVSQAVCGIHNRMVEAHEAKHRDDPREEHLAAYKAWPDMVGAEEAADEACDAEYYAVRYLWKLPVRSIADAVAKATFATEYAEQADTDEDFQADALRQIAEFLVPHGVQAAAE